MERDMANCVVIITGASTGIGRATALEFAKRNATVVVTGRREHVLQRLAALCEHLGGRALAIPMDVTDEQSVKSAAQATIEAFGRIDVWVNNAGVALFSRIEEAPYHAYRKVIETNLFGYIHGARAVIPYFRRQGSGTLINVASIVAKTGAPYMSAYAISKSGVMGLSDSLRMELGDTPDIHVCTILPASIDTPLFQHAANFSGRAIKPVEPIYSADAVALAILRAVKYPRREMYVGNAARQAAAMHAISPGLSERLITKQVKTRHFQDRPAAASEGNLFKPTDDYQEVDGGWRAAPLERKARNSAIAGLAALGIGLGLIAARRRLGPKITSAD